MTLRIKLYTSVVVSHHGILMLSLRFYNSIVFIFLFNLGVKHSLSFSIFYLLFYLMNSRILLMAASAAMWCVDIRPSLSIIDSFCFPFLSSLTITSLTAVIPSDFL